MKVHPLIILAAHLGCVTALAGTQEPAHAPVPTLAAHSPSPSLVENFTVEPGAYHFVVDSTQAPDLSGWVKSELRPVIEKWYPQIVTLLPGPAYQAPRQVVVVFANDLGGTPAYTMRNRIFCNAGWFRSNLRGEARGAVVHEMAHVVQHYGQVQAGCEPVPGWIVEGIADYIRWFLYEPESRGAEISKTDAAQAHYDASYRTSANFLDWICVTRDKAFVAKLNAICREGRYQESIWKTSTGKTAAELGVQWRGHLQEQSP